MKILVEIAQQTNVQFFKNIIRGLQAKGHDIRIVARDRELTLPILREYGFPYYCLSRPHSGTFGRYRELAERVAKIVALGLRYRPDLIFTRSYSAVLAAWILRVPSLLDEDDKDILGSPQRRLLRLASMIHTPEALPDGYGPRQRTYPGYKELAYLHPGNFTPDPLVAREAGVREGERYFILRFSAYEAFHDVGERGLIRAHKLALVKLLERLGRVFITSEKADSELERFRLRIPPGKMHSLLAGADLYAGDSTTVANEAAVLGVPSLRYSPFRDQQPVPVELERKYGLLFNFGPSEQDAFLRKAEELIRLPDLKMRWREKRRRMLEERVDMAAYYVSFVDGWGCRHVRAAFSPPAGAKR
jgi:hypothetical protein